MAKIPMDSDIPSNSQKARQTPAAVPAPQQDARPVIVPFDGAVAGVKRKKFSFLKWFKKNFLGDQRPRDILKNVVEQQIVPGIKDNFRNSMVSSLDMFIYQSAKPASQNSSNNSIQYNNVFRASQTTAVSTPSQPSQPNVDLKAGFSNPCFKSRSEAERFLAQMKAYDYPTLSVHTMYMMRSQHIDYTWDAYGWTREDIVSWDSKMIVHINNADWPWMLDLPQAHVIS